MKDCFNRRSEYLLKYSQRIRKTHCIHKNSPGGLNNILWQQLPHGEDYYISSSGIKYLEYNHFIWPRPTKP